MAAFGQRNTRAARHTPGQVMEIRKLYRKGWTQSKLCREFKISIGQIGRIVRGESWQDLPLEPKSEEEIALMAKASLEKVRQENPDLFEEGAMEKIAAGIEAAREKVGLGDRMLGELTQAKLSPVDSEEMADRVQHFTGIRPPVRKAEDKPALDIPPNPLEE